MASVFIQQLALNLFDEAVRTRDRSKGKLAWELMHWDEILGLGEYDIPGWDDDEPRPGPLGPWVAGRQWQMSPGLATELIRAVGARVAGDPDPQPNRISPFADRKLQLEAALNVRDKLQESMKRLEQTIADLKH